MFISWSILVDRLMGLAAMLTYSGVAGMLFYQHLKPSLQNSFFTFSLFFLLGLVFTAIVVAFVPKQGIEDFLLKHPISEKFLYPLFFFIKKPSKIVIPFFLSFGGQAMMVAIVYGLGLYLHVDIPWWYFLILVPYGFIATILPISPAGLGVGQMAFYYLFQQTLEQGEFGILAITFYQASQFIVGLGGGLLFVLYKKEVSDG